MRFFENFLCVLQGSLKPVVNFKMKSWGQFHLLEDGSIA
jgi:hypothetical protein